MSFWDGHRWIQEPRVESRRPAAKPRRLRDFAATGVMILGFVGMLAPLTKSSAAAATLAISPSSAHVGATVQLLGSNLPSKAQVQLALDGSTYNLPTLRVARDGTVKGRFVVPATDMGLHALTAVSLNRGSGPGRGSDVLGAILAAGTLTVTAPVGATEPTPVPSLVASPSPTPAASEGPSPTPEPSEVAPSPSATLPPPIATVAPAPVAPPPPPGITTGFVGRNGTQLVLDGAPFRFTGFNIYNANSRNNCAATMGTGDALDLALTEIGPGQEVIRTWFYQPLATTSGQRDWTAFDHTLSVAAAHGVRVIATLADQWGYCDNHPYTEVYKTEAWYREGYRSEVLLGHLVPYRDWVTEVVSRYRDNPTIAFWQLMNEAQTTPALGSGACSVDAAALLKGWADDVSAAIKSIDANHLVSLGTIGSGQCGAVWTEYQWIHSGPNIDLCEYHDYGNPLAAMPGDQWNGLLTRIQQCAELGKPIFVGELGMTAAEVGTIDARAAAVAAKLAAQLSAGVSGVLVWAWGYLPATYDIGPGDPVLPIVTGN